MLLNILLCELGGTEHAALLRGGRRAFQALKEADLPWEKNTGESRPGTALVATSNKEGGMCAARRREPFARPPLITLRPLY